MKEWRGLKLGDVITLQRGFDITKSQQTHGSTPIVSSSGISSYHNQYKAKGPGVVTGRKGTLGKVHYISTNYWPHDTTLWVKDFMGNNPKFVFYYLSLMKLENFDVGASNPTLNRNHLHKIKIICPPLPIQRKIAAILSAYDELIENNNRRVSILEKMAEEIYREWFVRLRFPGYENVKIVKGVPEGWKVRKIGECFDTYLGGTPSREIETYWNGDIPWINSGEVNKSRIFEATEYITEQGYKNSSTKIMPLHTTLLAITGATLGQVSFTEIEVCANQSVIGIHDANLIYNYYIFGYIKFTIQNIISKQGGGGQQHINKDIIEKDDIIYPKEGIVIKFNSTIIPLFESIIKTYSKNVNLKYTRDLLLPRLISGKLDVENLDIKFPPGMKEESEAEDI